MTQHSWSTRIDEAIRLMAYKHKDQVRQGAVMYPYSTHPFAVFLILQTYLADEDTCIAGLLHDTVEDTDYTFGEMKEDFGERVVEIVKGVTEPITTGTWSEKKRAYFENLKRAPSESVLVAAADKLHNFHSAQVDFKGDRDLFLATFKGDPEERLVVYAEMVSYLCQHVGDSFAHELENAFKAYTILVRHA